MSNLSDNVVTVYVWDSQLDTVIRPIRHTKYQNN